MIFENIILSLMYSVCAFKADCFLQLNGYKIGKGFWVYFKTMYFLLSAAFFAVSAAAFFLLPSAWIYVHVVLTVLLAVSCVTEKKKTPLRFTARMCRLMVTQWIFLLLAAFVFNPAAFLFLPFAAVLSVPVNEPVEICVRAKYITRAKNKLASAENLKVIAVTGSYGKTSVKNILYDMLSEKYAVVKTPSSYNTPMGIALCVNRSDFAGKDYFICEMGARKEGDIEELCRIVRPDIVVITGIAPQHLETFGSIPNIIKTKFEAVRFAKEDAAVFVNGDCPYLASPPSYGRKIFVCGETARDFSYKITGCGSEGCRFILKGKNGDFACKTKLLGAHNVSNICLCAAVGLYIGLNADDVAAAAEKTEHTPHRLQLIKAANGLSILDDSYNANVNGVRESMKVLKTFGGKKFVIASGIVEGGKHSAALNVTVGRLMADSCDYAFLVGVNAPFMKKGLVQEGFGGDRIFLCDSTAAAVAKMGGMASAGDVVLFSNDLPDNII